MTNTNGELKITKTYELKIRCVGEPCQFYTLRLFKNGNLGAVHTSKDLGYIKSKIPAGYVLA